MHVFNITLHYIEIFIVALLFRKLQGPLSAASKNGKK